MVQIVVSQQTEPEWDSLSIGSTISNFSLLGVISSIVEDRPFSQTLNSESIEEVVTYPSPEHFTSFSSGDSTNSPAVAPSESHIESSQESAKKYGQHCSSSRASKLLLMLTFACAAISIVSSIIAAFRLTEEFVVISRLAIVFRTSMRVFASIMMLLVNVLAYKTMRINKSKLQQCFAIFMIIFFQVTNAAYLVFDVICLVMWNRLSIGSEDYFLCRITAFPAAVGILVPLYFFVYYITQFTRASNIFKKFVISVCIIFCLACSGTSMWLTSILAPTIQITFSATYLTAFYFFCFDYGLWIVIWTIITLFSKLCGGGCYKQRKP